MVRGGSRSFRLYGGLPHGVAVLCDRRPVLSCICTPARRIPRRPSNLTCVAVPHSKRKHLLHHISSTTISTNCFQPRTEHAPRNNTQRRASRARNCHPVIAHSVTIWSKGPSAPRLQTTKPYHPSCVVSCYIEERSATCAILTCDPGSHRGHGDSSPAEVVVLRPSRTGHGAADQPYSDYNPYDFEERQGRNGTTSHRGLRQGASEALGRRTEVRHGRGP